MGTCSQFGGEAAGVIWADCGYLLDEIALSSRRYRAIRQGSRRGPA